MGDNNQVILKICKFNNIENIVKNYNSKIENFNSNANLRNRMNKITISSKSFYFNWILFKRDPFILSSDELEQLYSELRVFMRKINTKLEMIDQKIDEFESRIHFSSQFGNINSIMERRNLIFNSSNSSSCSSSSSSSSRGGNNFIPRRVFDLENDEEEIITITRRKRPRLDESL